MSSSSSATPKPSSCPCKYLQYNLSPNLAAEYGDIHALSCYAPEQRTTNRPSNRIPSKRKKGGGYTPLHLAAQHGNVAATELLLQKQTATQAYGNEDLLYDVNDGCGATPLHRASFSGAVLTMELLLRHANDDNRYTNRLNLLESADAEQMAAVTRMLTVPDISFGDLQTALHKAAAGGRPPAVKLLIDFATRQERRFHSSLGSLLQIILTRRDSLDRTPLQVAQGLVVTQELERRNVARWDTVANCRADWSECVKLLTAAERLVGCMIPSNESSGRGEHSYSSLDSIVGRIQITSDADLRSVRCIDCSSTVDCRTTAPWEAAFQKSLSISVLSTQHKVNVAKIDPSSREPKPRDLRENETSNGCDNQSRSTMTTNYNLTSSAPSVMSTPISMSTHPSSSNKPKQSTSVFGQACALCKVNCLALHRSKRNSQLLVCRKCLRK